MAEMLKEHALTPSSSGCGPVPGNSAPMDPHPVALNADLPLHIDRLSPLCATVREDMISSPDIEGPWGSKTGLYVDYAASGRMLNFFEQFMAKRVHPYYANTHTEISEYGRHMHSLVEGARQAVAAAVDAPRDQYAVIFTGSGSTAAIHKLAAVVMRNAGAAPASHSTPLGSRTRSQPAQRPAPYSVCDLESDDDDELIALDAEPMASTASDDSATASQPLVLVGPLEHHSNILVWREAHCQVKVIGEDAQGRVDLAQLEAALQAERAAYPDRLIIGSFSAGSNVTGVTAQVDDIAVLLHTHGALACFDYAAAGSYGPASVAAPPGKPLAYKDAIFLSPHKLVGGPGCSGVLVARRALFDTSKAPSVPGGGTVVWVDKEKQVYYNDIEAREEGGTPNILGNIRCGLAFNLWARTNADHVLHAHEQHLTQMLIEGLQGTDNISMPGSDRPAFFDFKERLGIVPFLVTCPATAAHSMQSASGQPSGVYFPGGARLLHHHFVAQLLNDLYGIQARSGCNCAGPYAVGLLDGLRVSFGYSYQHPATQPAPPADVPASVQLFQEMRRCATSLEFECVKLGWTRISLKYVLTESDIQYILEAVQQIAEHGWRLLPQYVVDVSSGQWTHRVAAQRQHQVLNALPSCRRLLASAITSVGPVADDSSAPSAARLSVDRANAFRRHQVAVVSEAPVKEQPDESGCLKAGGLLSRFRRRLPATGAKDKTPARDNSAAQVARPAWVQNVSFVFLPSDQSPEHEGDDGDIVMRVASKATEVHKTSKVDPAQRQQLQHAYRVYMQAGQWVREHWEDGMGDCFKAGAAGQIALPEEISHVRWWVLPSEAAAALLAEQ